MTNRHALFTSSTLLALALCIPANAAESTYERSEANPTCIRLNKIRSTEVIDSKHILFTLTNGEMYVNKLKNPCLGLQTRGAWINRVSYPEICDLGLIVPLNKMGTTLVPLGNCPLGKFEWVAKPQVEALRAELLEVSPSKDGAQAIETDDAVPAGQLEPAAPELPAESPSSE
jgi:hypothetical protein